MKLFKRMLTLAALMLFIAISQPLSADEGNQSLPPLFFREDFREIPAETPVTQKHIHNPSLTLGLHGSGRDLIKKSHHDSPPDDPFYIWSGQCEGTWMVTLTKDGDTVDLTRGIIRWRTKNFGRVLRVALETAGGVWMVSERGTGETPDWHEFTIPLKHMAWRELDSENVTAGAKIEAPDLTRIRTIGFTDLEKGGQSAACSRLDWMEVYGR